ncbi:hypothetical protein HMPREF0636_1131 [Porphyromonas catoniae ATCC 51270]|uniref:Uncharacterized protein n=1 Tax=Porphyromonas catoniae ATCC 51270 TaxID=887901 RepID=Z4WUQ0_9PORP|nr:hypothetical protein HMPREF0636_1131 [Porphyromonas catoniae ATCC 51270]
MPEGKQKDKRGMKHQDLKSRQKGGRKCNQQALKAQETK